MGKCNGLFMDQQEKEVREAYREYLAEGSTDIPAHEWPAAAMSFEEFCAHYKTEQDSNADDARQYAPFRGH